MTPIKHVLRWLGRGTDKWEHNESDFALSISDIIYESVIIFDLLLVEKKVIFGAWVFWLLVCMFVCDIYLLNDS